MKEKMKQQNSSTYVAILALVVSSMSLLLSYRNWQSGHLVAYEQRRQEVRQLVLEGELLAGQFESSLLEHVKTDKTPELREDAARIWKKATELHEKMKSTVATVEALPTTSRTKARLQLERSFVEALNANKELRELLKMAKKGHGISHEGGLHGQESTFQKGGGGVSDQNDSGTSRADVDGQPSD